MTSVDKSILQFISDEPNVAWPTWSVFAAPQELKAVASTLRELAVSYSSFYFELGMLGPLLPSLTTLQITIDHKCWESGANNACKSNVILFVSCLP